MYRNQGQRSRINITPVFGIWSRLGLGQGLVVQDLRDVALTFDPNTISVHNETFLIAGVGSIKHGCTSWEQQPGCCTYMSKPHVLVKASHVKTSAML